MNFVSGSFYLYLVCRSGHHDNDSRNTLSENSSPLALMIVESKTTKYENKNW